MYEQFFSFMGLREDPFHVSPDPRFYYSTPAHESALAELLYGIETRQGFLVLTGEAGTGKTCLLNQILDWLRRRGRSSAYIFHTHLKPIGLFRFILSDFGIPCQSKSKSDFVNALHTWLLQRHAAQDLPVLILDEAQGLPFGKLSMNFACCSISKLLGANSCKSFFRVSRNWIRSCACPHFASCASASWSVLASPFSLRKRLLPIFPVDWLPQVVRTPHSFPMRSYGKFIRLPVASRASSISSVSMPSCPPTRSDNGSSPQR